MIASHALLDEKKSSYTVTMPFTFANIVRARSISISLTKNNYTLCDNIQTKQTKENYDNK